jgi:hypothetical protein
LASLFLPASLYPLRVNLVPANLVYLSMAGFPVGYNVKLHLAITACNILCNWWFTDKQAVQW